VREHSVVVEIARTRDGGAKWRADKGINLPDSDLKLPALTAKDVSDLTFVVRNADMVSYSFVRASRTFCNCRRNLQGSEARVSASSSRSRTASVRKSPQAVVWQPCAIPQG